MFNYELTKDMTINKIKAKNKEDLYNLFIEFLSEKFGEDNVFMIETGTTSKKRELCFQSGTVLVNGDEVPIFDTINPTAKTFVDYKDGKGKTVEAFDAFAYKVAYQNYLIDKEKKAADKAAAKAKNAKSED